MKSNSTTHYAGLLGALGSPARLLIVRFLVKKHPQELTPGDIQSRLNIPSSTLSHHLEKLRQQELVRVRKDKQYLFYSLNTEAIEDLFAFFYTEFCAKKNIIDWHKISGSKENVLLNPHLTEKPHDKNLEDLIEQHIYERLGGKALQVLLLARMEAIRLGQEKIDTEHILLGLVGEGSGGAAYVLKEWGVDLSAARKFVQERLGSRLGIPTVLALTPTAQQILQFSLEAAIASGHVLIGSDHLLLGLNRFWKRSLQQKEPLCPALLLLSQLGLDPRKIEQAFSLEGVD